MPTAEASLSSTLHLFVEQHGAVVQQAVFDTLTPVIERLTVRGTDLPPTATSIGFSYRYDPESGAFVREVGPLDSIFVEPARTVGRGNWAVGASYQRAELTDFDGHDLAGQVALRQTVRFEEGGRIDAMLRFTELEVIADVVTAFVTYGLTEDWDVNVLLPVSHTRLSTRAQKVREVVEPGQPSVRSTTSVAASDDAVGFGDLLLRTKWRVARSPLDLALGLNVRAPTGAAGEFQGLGDWTVQPLLILGREFGRHEAHLTLGGEVDADDLERTRARYAVGASTQPLEGLALIVDLIGSSSFVDDRFTITSPNFAPVRSAFLDQFQVRPAAPARGGFRAVEALPRNDIVDVDVGVKWNPRGGVFVFVSALIPATPDGLRANVIPAVGVQYAF